MLEMGAPNLIALLGVLGIGSIIGTFVNGLFSKRKLSADATKVITDAASGVVAIQEAQLARVLTQNAALSTRLDQTEKEQERARDRERQRDEALAVHAFWDRQATAELAHHGIMLPEPPPLHPTGGVQ